jgi:predicted nucleic acid-binding protein
MKYVCDSCTAFKWVVPEADTDKAVRLRDDYHAGVHELWAPDVFPTEIAHALTRAERQGRVPVSVAGQLWVDVMNAAPLFAPSLPLLPRAIEISSQERIGVYDCLYVALAEREGCELVTADDRLVRNLQGKFPFVIPLASLP